MRYRNWIYKQKIFDRYAIIVNIILIMILTIVFAVMGNIKQISFCDEMFTYTSANSDMPIGDGYRVLQTGEWISGKQVRDFLSAAEVSLSIYKQISYYLYKDHVPLYFWIFRTISVLLYKNSCTKWIGLVCNYPFYVGLGIFINDFFRKRFGTVFSFLGTLLVMLHPCMIAQATFIRMYQMFTFIIVVFMLLMRSERLKSTKYRLIMGVILAIGCLIHYHFWIYVIAFSGFYGLALLVKKEYKQIFYYIQTCIIGLLITTICYPVWVIFLFSGKGELSINNLFNLSTLLKDAKMGINAVISFVFGESVYFGGVMLCGLIIVFMCIEHLKNYKFYVIAGATILYICVISHSVGGVLERYYWPAISIILVGIPYLTGIICERLQQNYNTVIRKKYAHTVV